jgi:hypothetical protein
MGDDAGAFEIGEDERSARLDRAGIAIFRQIGIGAARAEGFKILKAGESIEFRWSLR